MAVKQNKLKCFRCGEWDGVRCCCPDHQTIFHGDCTDVLPHIGPFECLVTDPPYGIVNKFGVLEGTGKRTLEFDWDDPEITAVVARAFSVVLPRIRPKGSVFCFCGGDQYGLLMSTIRAFGFVCKPAVWLKRCPPPPGKGNWWPSGFELAIYGYRSSAWFGDADPKRCNVFQYDNYRHGRPGKVAHPTQKPLDLMRRLVGSLCPPQDGSLIDPFMGSGTTLVASKDLGRRGIGIEREEKYCEIAANRLRQNVLDFGESD